MRQTAPATPWDRLLHARLPLLGGWIRRQFAALLAGRARAGDVEAARVLARALDASPDPAVRAIAAAALPTCRSPHCLDAAWQEWALRRGSLLAETLLAGRKAAATPPEVRVISLLLLQEQSALQSAPPALIAPLVAACADRDPLIAGRARYALTQLRAADAINALCSLWSQTRSPLLESALAQAAYKPDAPAEVFTLVALKFNRLERVTHAGAEVIAPLLAACLDADSAIREHALFCLLNLQNPAAINALCALWARERGELPARVLVQAAYLAQRPAPLRILTALKVNRLDIAQKCSAEALPALLSAAQDADAEISARANLALRSLALPETREALCALVINEDLPLARAAALEAAYLPQQPERRALFLFLTAQWNAYETLDFDQRLLNAVYESASLALRQRIMRVIQQAGRTEFLTILAGSDHRSRAAALTPIESALLVRTLASNREWQKLWLLVKELDLLACREAILHLAQARFSPDHPQEAVAYAQLAALAAAPMALTVEELRPLLPPAVPRATLKLNGRVNAVAFAPHDAARLAIALGSGRVVEWDYQAARVEAVHREFAHSVAQVAYTADGLLLAAERSAQMQPCGLYFLQSGHSQRFGEHLHAVTALIPLPDGRIFTTGRDARVTLWDMSGRRVLHTRHVGAWPRAACLSPNSQIAVLLKHSLEAISLDDLHPAGGSQRRTTPGSGVYRAAAVLSDDLDVLAGMFNGRLYRVGLGPASPPPRLVAEQGRTFVGIQSLPADRLAVAASTTALRFYSLPGLQTVAAPALPVERLTSLQISPDGAFMATGTGDSSMVLWDLRLLDLPALFTRPLAATPPSQLSVANALLEIESLAAPARSALQFYQALLQHRFAYDIQITEAGRIQAGEFDVLID